MNLRPSQLKSILALGCAGLLLLSHFGCVSPRDSLAGTYYPGVTVVTQDRSYLLTGNSHEQLSASLKKGIAEVGHAGYIRWYIDPEYSWEMRQGQCRMTDVTVDLSLTITTPKWDDESAVPDRTRENWLQYVAYVADHEEGHRSIAIKAVNDLARKMRALRATDCTAISREARRLSNDLYEEHKETQDQFDAISRGRARREQEERFLNGLEGFEFLDERPNND